MAAAEGVKTLSQSTMTGFAGAVGLSLAVHIGFCLLAPKAIGDGQYGMVFLLTVPLGAFTGAAITQSWRDSNEQSPHWLMVAAAGCVASILGIAILIGLAQLAYTVLGVGK